MNGNGRIVATFTSPIDMTLLRAALNAAGEHGYVSIVPGRPPRLAVCEPPTVRAGSDV